MILFQDMMTPINLGKTTIYLVSFFEGLQRIILFTEDPRVFKVTYESEKAELAEQEIVLALQDVGISLVFCECHVYFWKSLCPYRVISLGSCHNKSVVE